MSPKTILVGIDFSDESEVAAAQALEIARHAGAKIIFLHAGAIPDEPLGVPESMSATVDAFRAELQDRLHQDRERLEQLRQRFSGQGAEISNMVIEGFPDTGIVEAADELDADLVVVGTHGQTGIKRFLLGSVAERVVRLSRANVLVARKGKDVYKNILVPIDFSPMTDQVIETALSIAGPECSVELLHCWHLPLMASSYYAPAVSDEAIVGPIRDGLVQAAEERAQEIISRFKDRGVELTFTTLQAPPAYGITEKAEDGQYDCIVLASHGRRGIKRWLLGSVAEMAVRHSPCSVMVVHGEHPE